MLGNSHTLDGSNKDIFDQSSRADIRQIHIILDIDETLANGFDEDIYSFLNKFPHLNKFIANDLLINAIVPHFLHPGAIEFIQWLSEIPGVKISFFSSGDENRNTIFVQELLIRAFGNKANSIKNKIAIYSRKHLVESIEADTKNQYRLFKIYHGTKKKDLSRILSTNDLKDVILIDDNATYIAPGQERNVLLIRGTDQFPFYEFHKNYKDYPDEMGKYLLLMNHIFYITGLLSKITNLNTHSIADNLFNLQYKQSSADETFELNQNIYNEKIFYMDGLIELQKINKKLTFYGGEIAEKYFTELNHFNLRKSN